MGGDGGVGKYNNLHFTSFHTKKGVWCYLWRNEVEKGGKRLTITALKKETFVPKQCNIAQHKSLAVVLYTYSDDFL